MTLGLLPTTACDSGGDAEGDVSTSDEGGDGDTSTEEGGDGDSATGDAGDGDAGDGDGDSGGLPPTLPPLDAAPITLDERRIPTQPVEADATALDPRVPDELTSLLDMGYGDFDFAAGEQIIDRTVDGSAAPTPGASPTRLTRFVHLADMQLTDDESPTRTAALDNDGLFSSAFRPQEHYGCHILNAVVRTINATHREEAIDFVVLGGDNTDNAQVNETDWFNKLMDGGFAVACDSGDDDDPIAGENNDPKDPIVSEGLEPPWFWVTGNHDVLVQGNFTIDSQGDTSIGSDASGGTRDWSMPGGPVVTGTIVADPMRALVGEPEVMEMVMNSGDGHGITQEVIDYGKAEYVFDQGDVRMIVISTAADSGAADGLYRQVQVDNFLRDALDDAEADGKWAVVVSHHAGTGLGDGSGLGGMAQDDALTPQQFIDLLGEYDNVIMHLAGHSHVHDAAVMQPTVGSPYWQFRTAAIADFPHQMRTVEIHDQDNGFLTITGVALDYYIDDDPIAAEGYARGTLDMTSAWTGDGSGMPADRNVRLWLAKP